MKRNNPSGNDAEITRVDHWWTAGTTSGLFALTRRQGATFDGTWRGDDRIHFEIAFASRGKIRRIRGDLVNRPRPGQKYTWRYTRYGLAFGGRVAIRLTADRSLCAIHLPANMSSDGGAIVLADMDIDHGSVRQRVGAALVELDLTRAQFDNLLWASRTVPNRSR